MITWIRKLECSRMFGWGWFNLLLLKSIEIRLLWRTWRACKKQSRHGFIVSSGIEVDLHCYAVQSIPF